ncbi:radical SAM/SPASM domain-containing protein [Acidobacteriota bacterium]
MGSVKYVLDILPGYLNNTFARWGWVSPSTPFNVTYSVTNLCQSKCRTCLIWKLYKDHPEKRQEELKLDEIETMLKTMGRVFFFNISGGEPYLRKDFVEIVEFAVKYTKPGVVHIPTNGLAPDRVERQTRAILELLEKRDYRGLVTIKPSLDGVGEQHDEIRGVRGNFDKVIETTRRLQALKSRFPNLRVGLGTVISTANASRVEEIGAFVRSLGVDSYINEVAELREEMFNLDKPITPDAMTYSRVIEYFRENVRKELSSKRGFDKITQCFKLVYYDLAVRTLQEKKQLLPCLGGISNVHISAYGDLWPCCILAGAKSMGNIRDFDCDFTRAWHSKNAIEARRFIKAKNCHCTLENQAFSNILHHFPSLLRVFRYLFFSS